MCWKNYKRNESVIKIKDEPLCHIAEADFDVYKVMLWKNGKLFSYFRHSPYIVSKVNSLDDGLKLSRQRDGMPYIEVGFHSYTDECCLQYDLTGMLMVIHDGGCLQSYEGNDMVLAHCVIPKGSKYYVNDIGEVVSDRIIIKNYGFLSYTTDEKIKICDIHMIQDNGKSLD